MYDFLRKINSLKRTPRMGWLESGVSLEETEDVAQHSFEVSTITLLLTDLTNIKIDTEKTLKMAIIHDWAESVTGDFSLEMTQEIGAEVKEDIEKSVMSDILLCDIENDKDYLNIWKEYSKAESDESKLVHLADKISILIEAKKLYEKGIHTKKIKNIWNSVRKEVDGLIQEFPNAEKLIEGLEKL